jgi:hypothetical protein
MELGHLGEWTGDIDGLFIGHKDENQETDEPQSTQGTQRVSL